MEGRETWYTHFFSSSSRETRGAAYHPFPLDNASYCIVTPNRTPLYATCQRVPRASRAHRCNFAYRAVGLSPLITCATLISGAPPVV